MKEKESLTDDQKKFAIACMQWQNDYICGKFNDEAWQKIRSHLTEYFDQYSGPYGMAPKFEIHEMSDLYMSLNRSPHHMSEKEAEMDHFMIEHIYLWHDDDTEKYFDNISDGIDKIPEGLRIRK